MKSPYIRLEVFRHDEKNSHQQDELAQLTENGRHRALAAGASRKPKLNQGYIVASPRERAMHSAALQFFGPLFQDLNLHQKDLHGGLSEVKEKLSGTEYQLDNILRTDQRLNFNFEAHPEIHRAFYDEYNKTENNRTLDFQKDLSDQLILQIARKTAVDDTTSAAQIRSVKGFTQMVGDLAEVILEFWQKIVSWQELYHSNPSSFDDEEMLIFLGSHSQNIECFLMKIMEMKESPDKLQDFLNHLPHRKSFIGYSEGFFLKIASVDQAELFFQQYQWAITPADLRNLVQARDQFAQELEIKLAEV